MGWQIKANDKWDAVGPVISCVVYLDTGKVHSDGTQIMPRESTGNP